MMNRSLLGNRCGLRRLTAILLWSALALAGSPVTAASTPDRTELVGGSVIHLPETGSENGLTVDYVTFTRTGNRPVTAALTVISIKAPDGRSIDVSAITTKQCLLDQEKRINCPIEIRHGDFAHGDHKTSLSFDDGNGSKVRYDITIRRGLPTIRLEPLVPIKVRKGSAGPHGHVIVIETGGRSGVEDLRLVENPVQAPGSEDKGPKILSNKMALPRGGSVTVPFTLESITTTGVHQMTLEAKSGDDRLGSIPLTVTVTETPVFPGSVAALAVFTAMALHLVWHRTQRRGRLTLDVRDLIAALRARLLSQLSRTQQAMAVEQLRNLLSRLDRAADQNSLGNGRIAADEVFKVEQDMRAFLGSRAYEHAALAKSVPDLAERIERVDAAVRSLESPPPPLQTIASDLRWKIAGLRDAMRSGHTDRAALIRAELEAQLDSADAALQKAGSAPPAAALLTPERRIEVQTPPPEIGDRVELRLAGRPSGVPNPPTLAVVWTVSDQSPPVKGGSRHFHTFGTEGDFIVSATVGSGKSTERLETWIAVLPRQPAQRTVALKSGTGGLVAVGLLATVMAFVIAYVGFPDSPYNSSSDYLVSVLSALGIYTMFQAVYAARQNI